jgi:hypothetical protein
MDARDRIEVLERIAAAAGVATISAEPIAAERVKRRVDEGYCVLIGCAEHTAALEAEGLTENETRRFRIMVDALRDADALLGRTAVEDAALRLSFVRDVLYEAVGDAAGRIRARAAFAFRNDDGDARLRVFFAAYAPRVPRAGGGRRAMYETVELKLR